MKYHYKAVQEDGKVIEGEREAADAGSVLVFLGQKGLKPVSIKKISEGFGRSVRFFGQSITITDQVFLARYFALMLKVGADLLRVIDILAADFDKPILKTFLNEVRGTLEKGQPFYSSFARYPNFFSPVFVSLVKSGEISGHLDNVFSDLSISLERERDFRSRITSSLVYPIFILTVALGIVVFLVTFALPRISRVFTGSGFTPPIFSRIVFAVGAFLSNYIFLIIGVLALLLILIWYAARYTEKGKDLLSLVLGKIPVVSPLYKKLSLQRLTSTLSSLMTSGVPILEALRITSDVVSYPGMSEALRRVSEEGVAKGTSLGAAFRKELVFPLTLSNLVSISEKAGHIADVLKTLSSFYESETDAAMKRLVSVLEPVLLLLLGGFVGVIALAIILPIYQLVTQF